MSCWWLPVSLGPREMMTPARPLTSRSIGGVEVSPSSGAPAAATSSGLAPRMTLLESAAGTPAPRPR